MRKTFITNLILLLFLNILVKPFYIFGIDRTVQNVVGAEIYGVYAAMFSLSIIFNIILDMGIANFNNRSIAQDNTLLPQYFSSMVVLKFLLGIVYCIVLGIVGTSLGFGFEQFKLFGILAINQFLLSFLLYLRSNISGTYMYKTDSCISVIDRLLMILICGYLLLTHRDDFCIEWFVYAQTISYAIPCIIAFCIVLGKAKRFSFHFDLKFLLQIVKKTYPFALLSLLMSLYTRTDMVMIERMLPDGAKQAGIYAQSYRILDAVSMFAYLFATLLLPMFAKMLKDQAPLGKFTKFSFLLLLSPVLVFVIGCCSYSTELMDLMYEESIDTSAKIFQVLIIGFIPISSSYIFGTLLTANNNMKVMNLMAAAGMICNIGFNAIFIPKYGAWGAAVVSVITQFFTGIIQIILSLKYFKFHIPYKDIAKMTIFIVVNLLLFYFLKGVISENWIYNVLILCVIGFAVAFIIRLIQIKDIIYVLKNED
ncbi:MAG: polysaccharide biosynthesis C-terminal domain-containing protein [Bacteroidales bacterium]|nr:polysaccharide biosynthesis C-terminal domain-containing protein [Bacteroidales bacterium]